MGQARGASIAHPSCVCDETKSCTLAHECCPPPGDNNNEFVDLGG